MYDHKTYNWLAQQDQSFKSHNKPIILLNDFVDVALTSRAIALSKLRQGAN